jgi:hypothetical protein
MHMSLTGVQERLPIAAVSSGRTRRYIMIKKRIFISCRINEMRLFREAAIRAIEEARMEPLYFDSTDPKKRWQLKPGVPIILQLLEGVRTADAFLGIYDQSSS